MRVSVIIPTLEAESQIQASIERLTEQTIRPDEILIIDSASRDGTVDVASRLGCRVHRISRDAFDHGGTRNLGVGLTTGDVVVFMTQDAVAATPHMLDRLLQPLGEGSVVGTYARQLPRPGATPPERFRRAFNYPPERKVNAAGGSDSIMALFFSNVCSAVLRSAFDEVGGFPEPMIMDEDMALAAKLMERGYSTRYVPEACVVHSHDYSLKQQFSRYFDHGVAIRTYPQYLGGRNVTGEGLKLVREELSYLVDSRAARWIPASLADKAARWVGYKLGLMSHCPVALSRRFSMHKGYWAARSRAEPGL